MSRQISIRDALYGFVTLKETEIDIVQTKEFQRLRFIHQLGPTLFVYPSANHSRFEHSLGVTELSSRVINRLRECSGLQINKDHESVFRLACLLHDIGHAPFSHVGEDQNIFPDNMNHEDMAFKIIDNSKIGNIIEKEYGQDNKERIKFIIGGKTRSYDSSDLLFHELLCGQAGVDRMDYLLRDSYFLGVMYGKYDINRMIETIRFNKQKEQLYWERGGCHALEQFLLARYFMFTEVYFHKTRRSLDYHLGKLIKDYLWEVCKQEQFQINDINKYLEFQDSKLLNWAFKKKNYSEIFLDRKFFRVIKESSDHPSIDELEKWDRIEKEIEGSFDKNEYFFDFAEKAVYKFEKGEIYVEFDDVFYPLHEKSTLIGKLSPIKKRVLYAKSEKKQEILDFLRRKSLI